MGAITRVGAVVVVWFGMFKYLSVYKWSVLL